jgi:hypothetical protein
VSRQALPADDYDGADAGKDKAVKAFTDGIVFQKTVHEQAVAIVQAAF